MSDSLYKFALEYNQQNIVDFNYCLTTWVDLNMTTFGCRFFETKKARNK